MKCVLTTPRFERRLELFVRRHPELTSEIKRVMTVLARSKYPTNLKLHKLGGILKGCFSASISYEYRVIFIFLESDI